jgi:hypothetical protein
VARKLVVGVLGAAVAVSAVVGAFATRATQDRADEPAPPSAAVTKRPSPTKPSNESSPVVVPAPTTVAGYVQMFSQVDTAEWGGGDISYSVDLPDRRRVWLYGDTVSGNHGLVRNSAIVQDGGALHVSHGGEQVLPNEPAKEGRTTVYWPETARVGKDGDLRVVAAPISTGTGSVWDFHRTGPAGKSRVAVVAVDAEGNLTFLRWAGWQVRPDIDYDETGPTDIRILGPNHWGYAETTHPNIPLADGSHLVTLSQNWDDSFDAHRHPDGSLRYHDWQPLFFSTHNRPPV